MLSLQSAATCSDIIAAIAMVTLTLMTSRSVGSTDSLDVDSGRRWANQDGGDVVTWYNDVSAFRHNSALQYDEASEEEVQYRYCFRSYCRCHSYSFI